MRNSHDFAIAQSDQAFAQARFRFVVRKARGPLARSGKARRKFIKAIDARDFFDQIDFAFDVAAPRRLRAFPCREKGTDLAAILVHTNGSEAQGS